MAFIIFFGAFGLFMVGDGFILLKVGVVIAGLVVVLLAALTFSYIKMFAKNASVEVLEERIVLRNYRGSPTEIHWTDVKSFDDVKSDAPNLRIRTRFWTNYMVGGTIEDFSKLVEEVEKNSGMPIHYLLRLGPREPPVRRDWNMKCRDDSGARGPSQAQDDGL